MSNQVLPTGTIDFSQERQKNKSCSINFLVIVMSCDDVIGRAPVPSRFVCRILHSSERRHNSARAAVVVFKIADADLAPLRALFATTTFSLMIVLAASATEGSWR